MIYFLSEKFNNRYVNIICRIIPGIPSLKSCIAILNDDVIAHSAKVPTN